jgi:DNA-binding transcriptional LysR family regulator
VDRFDAMQVYVKVVETGSFTRAAEALQRSKTSVTQLVQQLEAHLQARLLHRTTRRLTLTTEGAAFLARAQQLLADLQLAEASVLDAASLPRGRVRLDVPGPIAQQVLIPALPDFFARYPEIQLQMGVSDRRIDLVKDGVDCVVRGGELTDSSLVARRVATWPVVACAAPVYLRHAGHPEHPEMLTRAPHCTVGLVSARTGRPLPLVLSRGRERVDASGRHALVVDDGNAYLASGLAGLGVVGLPRYMAEPHLSSGALLLLLQGWRLESLPMYVAVPTRARISTKVQVVMEWAAQAMQRYTLPSR